MKRVVKLALVIAGSGLLLGAALSVPRALRRMDSFNVRKVQVFGTHFLPPDEALRASGITQGSNVFNDYAPWVAALEKHPLIASARIERELPNTIRVFVVEEEPLALAPKGEGEGEGEVKKTRGSVGELVPVSAAGVTLPVDPTTVDLDLPVIASPSPSPSPSVMRARLQSTLNVLVRVKAAEPAMYGWISEAQALGTNAVIIRLRSPAGAEAILPSDPDAARLRQLRITLADLAARHDIQRLLRIDARYRDQIVVALTPKAAS